TWAIDKEARALPDMRVSARDSVDLAAEWRRQDPAGEARYWTGIGQEHLRLVLELAGDPEAAAQACPSAVGTLAKLVPHTAALESYRSDLAYAYWSLGRTLGGRGDPELWLPERGRTDDAEAAMRKSLTIAEGLVAKDTKDARTTVRVGATLANLAAVVADRDP